MSIHELSLTFASWLARETKSNHREELYMAYGLEILLGEVIKATCIIALAWIVGILPEVLTLIITAGVLRLASGGEHCSAYYRCLLGATGWFLLLGWGVKLLNASLSPIIIYLVAVCMYGLSFLIILKYAPGDTANKPIKEEAERSKFRKWSIFVMTLYAALLLAIASFSSFYGFVLPMAVGIIAQAFTVTPAGYKFIHFLDRIL